MKKGTFFSSLEKHGTTTEDKASASDSETKEETEEDVCRRIIKQIQRDEFGVGVELNEDGQRLMKVQQERLGRSLDRLSRDLYSKDTHFVLELVQNADDNSYPDELMASLESSSVTDECPAVQFIISKSGVTVLNNESGFREKDVRALCDVGRSTKGKHKYGYIGELEICGFWCVYLILYGRNVCVCGVCGVCVACVCVCVCVCVCDEMSVSLCLCKRSGPL